MIPTQSWFTASGKRHALCSIQEVFKQGAGKISHFDVVKESLAANQIKSIPHESIQDDNSVEKIKLLGFKILKAFDK